MVTEGISSTSIGESVTSSGTFEASTVATGGLEAMRVNIGNTARWYASLQVETSRLDHDGESGGVRRAGTPCTSRKSDGEGASERRHRASCASDASGLAKSSCVAASLSVSIESARAGACESGARSRDQVAPSARGKIRFEHNQRL